MTGHVSGQSNGLAGVLQLRYQRIENAIETNAGMWATCDSEEGAKLIVIGNMAAPPLSALKRLLIGLSEMIYD